MTTQPNEASQRKPRIVIRPARPADIPEIRTVMRKAYPNMPIYTSDQLQGQMTNFPEGQFAAVFDGRIVGYCATFIASEAEALKPHTWREITGDGFASRHTALGEWLYGMEVFVDPDVRGMRIGRRLYEARRRLCLEYGLRGVVIAGRLPRLARYLRAGGDAWIYIDEVRTNRRRDPVATFQLANGFELLGLLPGYLPSDAESAGYASLMTWRNPELSNAKRIKVHAVPTDEASRGVRIALAQYELRRIGSFSDFADQVRYVVETAAGYSADFLLLPEHFTLQLLSFETPALDAPAAVRRMTEHAEAVKALLADLAVRRNINIVGGSQLMLLGKDEVYNVCRTFLRDGSIHEQVKLHPTPDERQYWNVKGGSDLDVIRTDCGPVGIAVCYDVEFPEVARHLVNQGAEIIFVPTCTDQRQAFMRVRHCAAARAVENQCFVAVAGTVGNLQGVGNMDAQYAQSCVLTPCDVAFPPDGVALDMQANHEGVGVVELQLRALQVSRNSGAVQNLSDRRFDLYSVSWHKGD